MFTRGTQGEHMINDNVKDKPKERTIESELPDTKYITKFKKRENGSGHATIELVIDLHDKYDQHHILQEQLLKNHIQIDTIKLVSSWWTSESGVKYEGKSESVSRYSLISTSTANLNGKSNETIVLTAISAYNSGKGLSDLVHVVSEYIKEYEISTSKRNPISD